MADPGGSGLDDKLAYFQAITGLEDIDLCTEILSAHNWDLELAISSFTSTAESPSRAFVPSAPSASSAPADGAYADASSSLTDGAPQASPGIAWKLITLPFYVVSGGIGLISGAVGLGAWVAGSVLSRSLGILGFVPSREQQESDRLLPVSASAAEAADFVAVFERNFGGASASRPNFVVEGFMDALQRSQREFKLLFVYLHSPDHPDVPVFCAECLCSGLVASFVNENFVCWGGSIRGSEGFKMSNSLKASRFPFCAVVMASTNQRIALLEQVLVRFPTGERKERRFYSSTTVQALYDYVDSLDCLNAEKYSLVSNFPRVSYGPEKFSLSLKEAGLHPQASLFVEIES
ncbi:hypothetical protein KFK09_018042 [Dendrobium nobile]|uniref:UBX domain-containing protein n=1 Tax=Dendrobium nobile TaxID=94219 RepID=A0A8T3AUV1_DENNO|nr:hypothetical protein KFK09_018042 [Dendrobium nobile]